MLTGLSARDLGMSDGDAKLPKGATTIAEAVGQAGIPSAFFTANPLTSAAFGFDRGWSRFEAHLPTEDGPATRVFDAAAAWIDEHKDGRFLVVVHARGGHPPWDVSNERVKTLPPDNYAGAIDPKHAAELLARALRAPGSREGDADRERAGALYGAAMEAEDAGVGRVLRTLKSHGLYETTTVIVTSDVGVNDGARVPYAESGSVDEAALSVPLIIEWAHEAPLAAHVSQAVTDEDVAATVLAAFGLPPVVTFHGKDLRALADDGGQSITRPLLATGEDRFSLRWGPFVTSGAKDHEGRLCDVSLEPACVTDVRASYPLASRVLHTTLWEDLLGAKPAFAREPASVDPATLAALHAWGR
jgi:arylsulfatase A-like enzyme